MAEEKLEDKFNQALNEWRQKVNLFSSVDPAGIECDAYKKIVSMGREALPLIRRLYEDNIRDPGKGIVKDIELSSIVFHGLPYLVGEIVGSDYQIPEDISGRMGSIRDFTIKWLDDHGYR